MIGARRASWRIVSSIEQKEEAKGSEQNVSSIKAYRDKIEAELAELRSLSGPALDVRFLQLMLRHHEGGFAMLQGAVDRAQVPAVTTLAAAMLRAQTSEADTMRAMLAARGAAPLPTPTHGAMDHAGTGHGGG